MTPIPSSSQAKVLIYFIALIPPAILLVGLIPMIFFIFGVAMAQRSRDFGHIETAARNIAIYVMLILIVCLGFLAYFLVVHIDYGYYESREMDDIIPFAIMSGIAFAYLLATRFFLVVPLAPYRDWIEAQGIFSSKKAASRPGTADMEIIRSEKFRQYSVADELIKWSRLYEDGHIGRDEFDQIKGRLLGKAV